MKATMSPKATPAIRQPMAAPATAPPEIPPEDPSDDGEVTAKLVSDVEAVDVVSVDLSPVPLSVSSATVELAVGASDGFDAAVSVAAPVVATPITPETTTFCSGAAEISAASTVVVKFPPSTLTTKVTGCFTVVMKGGPDISVMG
jgi:hypothetical protein